ARPRPRACGLVRTCRVCAPRRPNQPRARRRLPMLADMIALNARTRPRHPALVAGGTVLDHAGFDRAVNRVASALLARGAREGALLALCLSDRPLHLLALWACARLGVPVLPMDWRWTAAE